MNKDWKGKKIVIIGAARQGLALTRYFANKDAQIVLTDTKPLQELQSAQKTITQLEHKGSKISLVTGKNPLEILQGANAVFVSGGVPLTIPLVQEAFKDEIPVLNDTQEFLNHVSCKVVVGITGSAGKTTTTTLVGRIAEAATRNQPEFKNSKVWIGGNIGTPLIDEVDRINPDDFVILELSSFQLELLKSSPEIAAFLNIKPDHLDRHASMDDYLAAKIHILAYQHERDFAVLGRDDPIITMLRDKTIGQVLTFGFSPLPDNESGAYIKNDKIFIRPLGKGKTNLSPAIIDKPLIDLSCIKLRGKHNLLNIMAACVISDLSGIGVKSIKEGICNFEGVSNRLEFVREWKGGKWFNDSIATTPERSIAAINSFNEPLILLAGGRDKNLPWDEFARVVTDKVKYLILFGEAAPKIRSYFEDDVNLPIALVGDLESAVNYAAEIILDGDIVLMSPGGTSFDEFPNYEARGNYYKQLVRNLP